MKRITIVRLGATSLFHPYLPPEFGGAEVRAATFARGLTRQGYQVRFMVSPSQDQIDLLQAAKNGEREVGEVGEVAEVGEVGEIVSVPRRSRANGAVLRRLLGVACESLTGKPYAFEALRHESTDIVLTFGVHQPSGSVVRWARQHSKPSVLFLTSAEDVDAAWGKGTPAKAKDQTRRRYAIRNANVIIAQTKYQCDRLRAVADRQGTLIPNPIDCEPRYPLLPLADRKFILWVGRDDQTKRLDLALKLARARLDIRFCMVVTGLSPGAEQAFRHCKDHLPDNVTLVAGVPYAQIDRYFSQARGLLNTSQSEGFPNAFLQAAKYGVPILSRRADPDGVLRRHGFGFVAGNDMDVLGEMVSKLWRCPAAFHHVSTAARNYVMQFHEAAGCCHTLSDVIERLASGVLETDAEQDGRQSDAHAPAGSPILLGMGGPAQG